MRAVEDALGITIPDNARIVRNLLEGIQFVQDHVIHFYHLHAMDWVDIVSALAADPSETSALQKAISSWPNNSPEYFLAVQTRLQNFVNSGQLGLFANAYWGHSAYKLPPAGNLLAAAHYLEALDWQRSVIKMHVLLGGKNPHPQTYLVGGVALPVDQTGAAALNPARIQDLRDLAAQALEFVNQVYLPDLKLLASFYPEWAAMGGGVSNYLCFGDFPSAVSGGTASFWLPRGVLIGRNLTAAPQPLDPNLISEYVTRSWYSYAAGDANGKHPSGGETTPNYTGPTPPYSTLNLDGKYSWLKAPRYNGLAVEVGPLARMAVAYAAGHSRIRQLVDSVLAQLGVGQAALFSTLGRMLMRGVETQAIAEQLGLWLDQLAANISSGNLAIHNPVKWDPSTWPAEALGWGATEAPRGALGHWIHIREGKIHNYQAVVASTWNGSPRDDRGQRGAWEEALLNTPVADPGRPVEILRTVHSFDPCMACAVHVIDAHGAEVTRVTVVP